MNLHSLFETEFDQHREVLKYTQETLYKPFSVLLNITVNSLKDGGKILFFGNGGSAADAQHLSTELVVRYKKDRKPIPSIALTTDSSAITAGGNDIGFENIFARQIEALANPGDIALGISTSGNSENVINGLIKARSIGAIAAGLGGNGGGKMIETADPYIIVPSKVTARIQEMHILIGHIFCDAIEQKLDLV